MPQVIFQPYGLTVQVEQDTTLLEAAELAGIHMRSDCAGQGACGTCVVQVNRGEPEYLSSRFDPGEGRALACRTEVAADNLEVFVPEESRQPPAEVNVEAVGEGTDPAAEDCLLRRVSLDMDGPTLEDHEADAARLKRALDDGGMEDVDIPLRLLRDLPRRLRGADWEPEVLLAGMPDGWRPLEVGSSVDDAAVLAVDIGTTVVKATLLSPRGRWTASCANSQGTYGPDVITRIIYCDQNEDGLDKLQGLVADDLNRLAGALADEAGLETDDLRGAVVGGNTTMMHLLMGLEPSWIRQEPYVGCCYVPDPMGADVLGLNMAPAAPVYPLPSAASYVGADIAAGVLSTGMTDAPAPRMLIDLGTNGEIVVGSSEFLLCCSGSAGPAFEGGGSASGTWAQPGAINKVHVDGGMQWSTIDDESPVGICGTGYIDLLAALMKVGVIDKTGNLAEGSTDRVRHGHVGPEYVLVEAEQSATDRDIVLTQADINNLVRAKGAIYAAACILLENLGMEWSDMDSIMLAGGFGEKIDVDNAVMIGLLPDVPRHKIEFVGNSSLAGAVQCAEDLDSYSEVRDIAISMTYFELSTLPDYMDRFTSACFLPHTDTQQFPSVAEVLAQ
ncbi:MAG: ASKHA domain-containing protein [Planctomycetota bacterium]